MFTKGLEQHLTPKIPKKGQLNSSQRDKFLGKGGNREEYAW